MKPVFDDELNYLGIDKQYSGYIWTEHKSYYAYDKSYNIIKFGRKISNIVYDINKLSTHMEFCKYVYDKSTKILVDKERKKLQEYLDKTSYDNIFISVSGGKDSTVVEHMCGDICRLYYSTNTLFCNTTNETHHTYRYVLNTYKDNLIIVNPDVGFYNWCKDGMFIPTRFTRGCCTKFKEDSLIEKLKQYTDKRVLHITGIRKSESSNRKQYTQIRKGHWRNKDAQNNWDMYLPILDFTDLDVWAYIFCNNLKFNKLYEYGYNRVGCTNCPYRTDYEIELNRYFLPSYHYRWMNILAEIFVESGTAININCTLEEFINGAWRGGVVRDTPTEEVILDFAKYKQITFDDAKKYFKANKCSCGKKISKDVIALNMKLLGRNTNSRMCLKCLSEYLKTTKKELKQQIREFKQQGCRLF